MAIYGYTKNYKLIKPQFDTDTWHDYVYDNLDTIDAVLSAIFASGDWQGFWKSNTHYNVGGVVIDRDTDTMYKVMVEHTTSEATFAEEFAAHPTYYELWSPNNLAEDWAIKMDGVVSNVDYSSKAYAISSGLIDDGSAKEWAVGSGTIGDTGEYSAKKHATDAHNDYISMTTDPNVVAVGTNIASVNTVSASISGVNTTASNISSVNTVASDISRVNLVADDIASVHTVAIDISNVIDVAASKTNIDTVAGISADVSTTATIATSIHTVADNDANITTVATNISDVNTAATNMAAIQAAPTAASNAAASATLSQEWATKMDGQVASTDYSSKYYASESATSATNAATSESHANIWAEGTDVQVQALGGTHSAKVWAEQSTNANVALTNSPYTTNRILEIPQDIKLELNNGTLTLKAGSKVYVPNGFKSDGTTPKFDTIIIESDVSSHFAGVGRGQCMVFYQPDANELGWYLPSECVSGTTQSGAVFYNTSTNTIKFISENQRASFSFGIIYETNGSGISSIDQVFNGFGYIGSTVFALPRVKVQIPIGRNEDGTYKFISVSTQQVSTWSWNGTATLVYNYIDQNGLVQGVGAESGWYDSEQNWFVRNTGEKILGCIFSSHTHNNARVENCVLATTDSVANSNASNFSQAGRSEISRLASVSKQGIQLTLGASGSKYVMPANGRLCLKVEAGGCQIYVNASQHNSMLLYSNSGSGAGTWDSVVAKVTKGDVVTVYYGGSNQVFYLVYDNGEV